MTIANLITVSRIGMMFAGVLLLYHGGGDAAVVAMLLIAASVWLDAVDGIVARRRGEASSFGAIMDIAGDRVIESVMWIVYADLQVIDVWVPIVVVARGVIVDAIRASAYSRGESAFGPNTMMQSPVARFLTGGRGIRALYGISKMLAFAFLAGMVAYRGVDAASFPLIDLYEQEWFRIAGWAFVWLSVALTLVRGLPVVLESIMDQRSEPAKSSDPLAKFAARAERLEIEDPPVVPGASS